MCFFKSAFLAESLPGLMLEALLGWPFQLQKKGFLNATPECLEVESKKMGAVQANAHSAQEQIREPNFFTLAFDNQKGDCANPSRDLCCIGSDGFATVKFRQLEGSVDEVDAESPHRNRSELQTLSTGISKQTLSPPRKQATTP